MYCVKICHWKTGITSKYALWHQRQVIISKIKQDIVPKLVTHIPLLFIVICWRRPHRWRQTQIKADKGKDMTKCTWMTGGRRQMLTVRGFLMIRLLTTNACNVNTNMHIANSFTALENMFHCKRNTDIDILCIIIELVHSPSVHMGGNDYQCLNS